ncbi:hypothetical protein [Rhodopirellula europaea]|uniref:hypothetical protein n=1 Tax=Rhodopirellula europaea TaxID=1263866 RepID=UPI003D292F4A
MNPDVLTNVLLQVPALAVVVYLVIHFFNYLKSSREDERDYISRLTKDQSDIIDRNTQALLENRQMADETRKTLAEMRVVLEQRIARMPVASERIDDDDSIV